MICHKYRPQYSVVTPHIAEPVSYDEAATHCRVDSDIDRDYITALICVARQYVENLTDRASTKATYKVVANSWHAFSPLPLPQFIAPITLQIRRTPIVSVSSIKYYEPGGTQQLTLSTDNYTLITSTEPGMVLMKGSIPVVDVMRPDSIEITFIAGHNSSQNVPPMMRHAIKMMVAHLYDNRASISESSVVEIPYTLSDIIKSIRIGGCFS